MDKGCNVLRGTYELRDIVNVMPLFRVEELNVGVGHDTIQIGVHAVVTSSDYTFCSGVERTLRNYRRTKVVSDLMYSKSQ